MDYNKLPGNSITEKQEKKVVKQVTAAPAKRKENTLRGMKNELIKGTMQDVKRHVVFDIILPSLKDLVADMGRSALDTWLYGSNGASTTSNRRGGKKVYTNYNGYNQNKGKPAKQMANTPIPDYDNLYMPTRAEAERVLMTMQEFIEQYGMVSVAELYSLVGITGQYTDNDFGWFDLGKSQIRQNRDGYFIDFIRPVSLK